MIEVDFICKRYGVLPSEILKLNLDELNFILTVASLGVESDGRKRS